MTKMAVFPKLYQIDSIKIQSDPINLIPFKIPTGIFMESKKSIPKFSR